jgi:hypothetical protein
MCKQLHLPYSSVPLSYATVALFLLFRRIVVAKLELHTMIDICHVALINEVVP